MPFRLWKKRDRSSDRRSKGSSETDKESYLSTPRNSNSSAFTGYSGSGSEGDVLPRLATPEWFNLAKMCFESSWSSNNEIPPTDIPLAQFQQMKTIGSGCFGPIVLVCHKESKRHYALKVLQKHLLYKLHQGHKAETEKRILSSIQFPFLLSLSYQGQDSFNLYLYTEYMAGGDLWHLMQRQKSLELSFGESDIRFYISQVILGLEYLHHMDLVYRDLKPENIFIDMAGYLKIGDFGYTKRIRKDGKATTQCGTREYMAPEIVIGQAYNRGVDYWALGVLIYEFVSGATPFFSSDLMETYERIVVGKYTPLRGVSKGVKDLIQKFLTVDSGRRLGYWKHGIRDVRNHAWFVDSRFPWTEILYKRQKPPFVPKLQGPGDTKYFKGSVTHLADSNNNPPHRPHHLFKQQETPNFVDYYDHYFENF